MEYKFYNICRVYFRLYNFIFCIYYSLVIDSCTPLMETSFCGFRLAWKNKVVLVFLSYFLNVNYGQVYGSLDGLDDSRRPTQEV